MYIMLCCFGLFLLVFALIVVFHMFVWNVEWGSLGSMRCWVSPYECGFTSQLSVVNYFSYTCFVLLVFFVVFDLEISLLLNLPLQGLLFKNLSYYLFFLVLLCLGYSVEVYKGYALWVY
uniref:NADH-ubiquinone oxidoreductase chain 3 n=1 Tax=Homalogaster paloniae TaxID=123221 RepID=A0A1P7ZIN5_9TREM|nr:NADH dehydrogenase subunit 3 [Homalogaster paloniae]